MNVLNVSLSAMILWFGCFKATAIGAEDLQGEATNNIPYTARNCRNAEVIEIHENCPSATPDDYCFHIEPIADGLYPYDGFCLVEDPNQGLEPGVVGYNMKIRIHNHYIDAGVGVYYNYQDDKNYDVVYKIDYQSSKCIIGHVENGLVFNSSNPEFDCVTLDSSDWLEFEIYVTADKSQVTLTQTESASQSVTPHYQLRAKAGPLILNAYGNSILHSQIIRMETETCNEDTSNDLCDPCQFAYNEQSVPEYLLPNHRNFLLWHSRALEMVYTVCYIKVLVIGESESKVKASSFVGEFTHDISGEAINIGDLYGHRSQCTENQIACVEIKSGGSVTDGVLHSKDKTLIEVKIDNINTNQVSYGDNTESVMVNNNLYLIYGDDIVEESLDKFSMYVNHNIYGSRFGIYCNTQKENQMRAQDIAYSMCLSGSNNYFSNPLEHSTRKGWAVKFQN